MKHLLVIFIVIILFSPATAPAHAEEPVTAEEIVVTAKRIPQPQSEIPDNISILTAEELEQMPVNDLAEALNLVTGVDIQGRGQFGQPSSVTIQGCEARHVRVMVDGVLLNSQGNAFADPSQIPIENVERIEIIKGAASSIWGSSLGGVINVVTKSPKDPVSKAGLGLSYGWGPYEFWKRNLEISGATGKLGYYLWESSLDTNGEFRDNSEITDRRFSAKFNYAIMDNASIEAAFHYNGADIGGFEFTTQGFGEDYLYLTRYGYLKFSLNPKSWWDINAAAKFSSQSSTLERFMLNTGAVTKVDTTDSFSGMDIASRLTPFKGHTIIAGTDLGRDKLESDQIADEEILRRQGYYANYTIILSERYDINFGGRYDDNAAFGKQFSPSAGLVYHLPYWETDIRASAAKAFNAPPLLYKYISGNPFLVANETLKAERAVVYEAGVETKPITGLWLKFSAYRAEVKDQVNFVLVVPPWTSMADNIDRVRRQGMEAETNYDIMKNLQAQAGWSINRIQNRETGKIVQGNGAARLTYNLGLNYNYGDKLNCNLKGHYHFWNQPVTANPLDRRFIWDAHINYDLSNLLGEKSGKRINCFLNIYNIFNRQYWYDQILPFPGRRLEFGMGYDF
ncbi:MAG: TonB-dependent receptor [Planctomycetes bacterium]|nr:TonB-dependent receptor [Planctomycetota bacterium]